MDVWNPIAAETYVRRLRWWETALAELTFIALALVVGWGFAVIVLSLDILFPSK